MDNVISDIRQALKDNIDEKYLKSSQKFFKEKVIFYGVGSAIVEKIAKEYYKMIKDRTKSEIFDLCEIFWQSGYMEESFIACHWSHYQHKNFTPGDFVTFERWVKNYLSNWASCATLCHHHIGEFLEMYPGFISETKKWTHSTNRWVKRAAAVSLIIPARKGKFQTDILEIADALLLDTDDLVQKGYGWMLKAASQSNQKAIFDYVMSKKAIMPRTSLRYAIEKMPKELKAEAMKK